MLARDAGRDARDTGDRKSMDDKHVRHDADDPAGAKALDALEAAFDERLRIRAAHVEVMSTGVDPEDVVLVQKTSADGQTTRWWFEPRTPTCGRGHVPGLGDPCGWCAEIEEHLALRARVATLLAAAASGDAEGCSRVMENLA